MDIHFHTLDVATTRRGEMVELTDRVAALVRAAAATRGYVIVYVPHTTAGITINENADPDVAHDMLAQLDAQVPWRQPFHRHAEGNSAAHVKASMMGSSVTVLIQDSRLLLGRWQGIWFCEFDGPRQRRVFAQIHCFA